MLSVLMVAEKPSIAEIIATILSNGHKTYRKGISPVCGVYEYDGRFLGQNAHFKVTSTAGHVYSIDFPSSYNNWDKTPPETLFDAPTKSAEANPKTKIPAHLSKEASGCDYLVLWLDCDREGENICFEVLDCVKSKMRSLRSDHSLPLSGPNQQIWRAQFSSLADVDIRKAMERLGSPNENESLAVDARQELDLKIGVAFTRFQTKYFQGKYGDLDSRLISYGPCQTPTLFFCVQRQDEIASFQPETFYRVDVEIETTGKKYWLEWDRGRVFDQAVGKAFKDLVAESGSANVTQISMKEDRRARPLALNTVAMLKGASQSLGMGPDHAMSTAESLYLQKAITYPRTETSSYPKNFDLRAAVATQHQSSMWGDYARQLSQIGLTSSRSGTDKGDHPPITPVGCFGPNDFKTHDAWRLYEYITRHFLATVSGDCIFKKTKVTFQIGEEIFHLSGRRVIDPGFTAISKSGEMEDAEIPELRQGDRFVPTKITLTEGKTQAPDYLSESDLLSLMEKHGIGTDASMATHIKNICERNYVELMTSGRRLQPTKLGVSLVHGYMSIDHELVLPSLRASIESQCSLVAEGKAEKEGLVSHTLSVFRQKFDYFVKKIEKMDALFESTFTALSKTGEPFSRCGHCHRYMKLIRSKPARLYCNNCSTAYNLPPMGSIKLYQGLTCPLDNFELVLSVQSGGGKSFPLCPLCFNDPPYETHKTAGKMSCLQCEHPTCKHSLISQGICLCPQEGCSGTICLDVISRPKWKLDCNKCNFQLVLPDTIHKVSVLPASSCEGCGSSFVEIVYHKDKIQSNEDSEITGCIVCDPKLNKLFQGKFSRTVYQRPAGSSRGRGGRGRRGRGRGRGRGKVVDPKMTFDRF